MYRVGRKDSLQSIAAKHNTTTERLIQLNRLASAAVQSGQVLLVPRNGSSTGPQSVGGDEGVVVQAMQNPAPTQQVARVSMPAQESERRVAAAPSVRKHKVRSGETLSSISQRYGRSVTDIKRANGIKGNRLVAGQVLRIP